MTPHSDWKDGFLFVGNHLALDFLNTRPVQNGEPMELLPDFSALLRWFRAADLLSSREAASLQQQWGRQSVRARHGLEAMRALRERLRKEILAWEGGGAVHHSTVDELNRLMAEHPMRTRLKANGKELSTELYFEPHNRKTCLRRWRTAQRCCSPAWIAAASASAISAYCTSMTPARRGRAAGAACNYAEIV